MEHIHLYFFINSSYLLISHYIVSLILAPCKCLEKKNKRENSAIYWIPRKKTCGICAQNVFFIFCHIKMGQWFVMKQHLKNLESKPSVKLFNNRK